MAENPIICEVTISAETYKRLHAILYDEMKEELEKLARWRLESLGAELWIGRGEGEEKG